MGNCAGSLHFPDAVNSKSRVCMYSRSNACFSSAAAHLCRNERAQQRWQEDLVKSAANCCESKGSTDGSAECSIHARSGTNRLLLR